jgi:dUTP pyrophosphatase
MFQFSNFGLTDITIKKGERIGQGIFLPFLKADNDDADTERKGGFGSSGKQ